jgi:UDP-N-acetylmuramoylalanine--D-glutamate ligase
VGNVDTTVLGAELFVVERKSIASNHSTEQSWAGCKALVIGVARQGLSLAEYLVQHGAHVILNDARLAGELASVQASLADRVAGQPGSLRWVCGAHPLDLLDEVSVVFVSGGVPLTLPLVVEAGRRGIPLSNDSQIFMAGRPCKAIGITGSAGKSTTTTLVGRIAGESSLYEKVWVGGNLGSPLIAHLDEMTPGDLAVLELSSFQLEIMDLAPDIAAILNITPNHLDRHGTMEAYAAAKARILDYQPDDSAVVLGRDDPGAWSLKDRVKGQLYSFGLSPLPPDQAGAYIQDGELFIRLPGRAGQKLFDHTVILLRGEHNLLNVLAAAAIAAAAGIEFEAIRRGVDGFRGIAHRLEYVRTWHGAEWYNDSIATAPERVIADIHSFDEPLVLLCGGRDKKLPWEDFARLVYQRVDHLILFGEAAEKINRAMHAVAQELQITTPERPTITICSKLAQAVEEASRLVQPGDVVLLSPGGTSFDEFHDFEERGECFARWVRELP